MIEKIAYLNITEDLTPFAAAERLGEAKKCGFDTVLVFHGENVILHSAEYKERLLGVFRGAYRHKMGLYIADDCFFNSGTAFGELCTVRDMRQKKLVRIKKSELGENVPLWEDEEFFVAPCECDENEKYPYGHYPLLTDCYAAEGVIDRVYKFFLREFKKFVGYELKGFICRKPLCEAEDGSVLYSKEALCLFEERHGAENKTKILDDASWQAEYKKCIVECVEKNFILPLKAFCEENGLGFIVTGGEGSLQDGFCRKESDVFVSEKAEKGAFAMESDGYKAVLAAALNGARSIFKIDEKTGKLGRLEEFLVKEDLPVVKLEDVRSLDSGCIITNLTEKEKEICLIPGDYYIVNWENGECYEPERVTYTFYPYSFLCIKKKSEGIYPEFLPVAVGAVGMRSFEGGEEIEFSDDSFTLPEDNLVGRCVVFEGDFESLFVKIGSMEKFFVSKPFVMPLFGFMSGIEGKMLAYGGKVEKIKIV